MSIVSDHPAPAETARRIPASRSVVALDLAPMADGSEHTCGLPACGGESCRASGCPPKRWLYASIGCVCFGIAAAGAVLPIVPTTFPLMLALLFFARSSPTLERRVRAFKLFRPYLRYVDGSTPMPMRAKVISCVLMWTPVLIVSWMLFHSAAPDAAWIGTLSLAVIGTPVIFFWRPKLVG